MENTRMINARKRRLDGNRTGREYEFVVAFQLYYPCRDVAQGYRLPFRVDGDGFRICSHLDGELVTEQLRIGNEQARFVFNDTPDMVRQAAIRVRHIRSALDHDDFGVLVDPAQPGGARGPTCDATNNHYFHSSVLLVRTRVCLCDLCGEFSGTNVTDRSQSRETSCLAPPAGRVDLACQRISSSGLNEQVKLPALCNVGIAFRRRLAKDQCNRTRRAIRLISIFK